MLGTNASSFSSLLVPDDRDDVSDTTINADNDLIHVSPTALFISTLPLLGLALASYSLGLGLESPIVVGLIRTLVQLSILGAILHPIFYWGNRYWYVVVSYGTFMVALAAAEATARSRYYFAGMLECVLAAIALNIGLISLLAFGAILRPQPVWDPQYVIPIVGMLLGNCINGVALSTNATLTALKESSQELENYLAYGGSPQEASKRLMREAVRVGAMPGLNSMAVIGIISIPGMMTGQILGGSAPMEAAVYQMLITILIATSTFATILSINSLIRGVGFDAEGMLRTDRFLERPRRLSFLERLATLWQSLFHGMRHWTHRASPGEVSVLNIASTASSDYVAPKGKLQVTTIRQGSLVQSDEPVLRVVKLSRTIGEEQRTLFRDLSFDIKAGDIVTCSGPSGVGKSQLLRLVGGLSPMTPGSDLLLSGASRLDYRSMAQWRRQVLYVSQYKVDVPGTPRQFVQQVSDFGSWKVPPISYTRHSHVSRDSNNSSSLRGSSRSQLFRLRSSSLASSFSQQPRVTPTAGEMTADCFQLVQQWGLDPACMDAEWKSLSGGEAQRVHLAIALASKPRVLLLDEATSALDMDSKLRVEQSIEQAAAETGLGILWITHDQEQMTRMADRANVWDRRLARQETPSMRATV